MPLCEWTKTFTLIDLLKVHRDLAMSNIKFATNAFLPDMVGLLKFLWTCGGKGDSHGLTTVRSPVLLVREN